VSSENTFMNAAIAAAMTTSESRIVSDARATSSQFS
jgi:hypothetical protein